MLVFEDLHWADDGLLDFVDHLADWSSGVPLFVVGTARPELLDRRPGWGGGKLNATTLPCRRSPTLRLLRSSPVSSSRRCSRPRRSRCCSSEPAATRSMPSSSRASTSNAGRPRISRYRRRSRGSSPRDSTGSPRREAPAPGCRGARQGVLVGRCGSARGPRRAALEQALHSLERKGLVRRERRSRERRG